MGPMARRRRDCRHRGALWRRNYRPLIGHRGVAILSIFDTDLLRLMTQSCQAAIDTVRLSGRDPHSAVQVAMARRLIGEAGKGTRSRLLFAEATLDGVWW
jgi:hypothetical protein